MSSVLNEKDISDATKISLLFSTLSEEDKTMAMVYMSALRDKEIAEDSRELQEA